MSRIADLRSRFETPSSNASSPRKPPLLTGRRLLPPGATSPWGTGTLPTPKTEAVPSAASPSRSIPAPAPSRTPQPPARLVHLHDVVAPPGTGALMAAERRAAEAELDAQANQEESISNGETAPTEGTSKVDCQKQDDQVPEACDRVPTSPPPALMMTELDGTTLANPFTTREPESAPGATEESKDSTHFSTISQREQPDARAEPKPKPNRHHRTTSSTSSADWSAKEASRAGRAGRNSALYGPPALPPLDDTSIDGQRPDPEHPTNPEPLKDEFEKARRASARLSGIPTAEAEGAVGINWSFWGRVMNDYQDVAQHHPEELSRAVQAGVPDALRGMVWQLMSGSKNEELELIYAYYLKEQQHLPTATSIREDVARTLSSEGKMWMDESNPPSASAVGNIVAAYSLYDPACGTCAGVQYVVAALVSAMPDEEAFSALVRLMRVYDLRGHYAPGLPSLQLRLYQLARLVEEQAPLLHAHLGRQKVKVADYAAPWFMTAFAYRFPPEMARRVLDAVFAEGLEVLFRFALTVLLQNEPRLLACQHDDALRLLHTDVLQPWAQGNHYDIDSLVSYAFTLRIDALDLDTYTNEFEEKVRAAAAHRREMESLTLVHRNLSNRMHQLKEAATAQSAEQVELTKQIVVANLAREEMASELARYKMMYAEAVLAADQARVRSTSLQPASPAPSAPSAPAPPATRSSTGGEAGAGEDSPASAPATLALAPAL